MLNENRYRETVDAIHEFKINYMEEDIEAYADLFETIGTVINNKLSTREMVYYFDFFSELILGHKPKYVISIPKDERIRTQLRIMEETPKLANALNDEEKEFFAFCVYYCTCVQVFDSDAGMMRSGLADITSVKKARELLQFEKETRPGFFEAIKKNEDSQKGDYGEDYGLSINNPVLVTSVSMGYEYLNRLRYNGHVIEYNRIGSVFNGRKEIIDKYALLVEEKGLILKKRKAWYLFINAYSPKPVLVAPKGMTLEPENTYTQRNERDIIDIVNKVTHTKRRAEDRESFKTKAEHYIRRHQNDGVIAKLRRNIPLMEADVKELEDILWREVGTQAEYEEEYGSKPLGEFVREIAGLDMTAVKAAFSGFLDDKKLDSRQFYFVNQIMEYIAHNGMMKDLSVLQEPPFTNQGSIVEVFTDLSVWLGVRKVIDQINANAAPT